MTVIQKSPPPPRGVWLMAAPLFGNAVRCRPPWIDKSKTLGGLGECPGVCLQFQSAWSLPFGHAHWINYLCIWRSTLLTTTTGKMMKLSTDKAEGTTCWHRNQSFLNFRKQTFWKNDCATGCQKLELSLIMDMQHLPNQCGPHYTNHFIGKGNKQPTEHFSSRARRQGNWREKNNIWQYAPPLRWRDVSKRYN